MQIYLRGALLSSMVAILFSAFLGVGAQQPGAQPAGAGRGRGHGGRSTGSVLRTRERCPTAQD